MTDQNFRQTFNQRLNAIEAKRIKAEVENPGQRGRALITPLLRLVAVVPVVVILAKAWTMAFMGLDPYMARLLELHAAGGIAATTATLLVPDRLSLGLAGLIAGLPGLS